MAAQALRIWRNIALLGFAGLAGAASAGTFVYVSNDADGDISAYTLVDEGGGRLVPGGRAPAGELVMPLAASQDGRFLYAAVRKPPYAVHAYRIDPSSGALDPLGAAPLPDSMVSISIDRGGRWLLGASYGGNTLSVNAILPDGRIAADPAYFGPSGGVKPHAIWADPENRRVHVPHLGSDEIRSYPFDPATGRFGQASSTPLPQGSGPRHMVFSPDGRHAYLLSELTGTVTAYRRDAATGGLASIQTLASLPRTSTLVPGQPRVPSGTPGAVPFDESKAIWSADIQITPDGRFLYTSERTQDTLSLFVVDRDSGRLRLAGITPTERQPRGFAIDPSGRFLVASGQLSPTLSLYAIDPATGELSLRQQVPAGKGANWVQIVQGR